MFFKFHFITVIKSMFIFISYGIYADFNYIDKNVVDLVQEDKKDEKIKHYRNRSNFFILMSDKFDKDKRFSFQFTNKDNNEIINVDLNFKEKYILKKLLVLLF